MTSRCPRLLFIALACAGATLRGQEPPPVRASTVLHQDGTRTETRFDPENHRSESNRYSGSKLLQRSVFQLNAQNQPESALIYDGQGRLVHKVQFVRDDTGRVTEEIRHTPDDRFLARLVYRYASDGRVVKMEAYDENGNPLRTGPAVRDDAKKKRRQKSR